MRLYQLKIKNFRGLKGDRNVIKFEDSDIIFLLDRIMSENQPISAVMSFLSIQNKLQNFLISMIIIQRFP